jgi:hypothetical protein
LTSTHAPLLKNPCRLTQLLSHVGRQALISPLNNPLNPTQTSSSQILEDAKRKSALSKKNKKHIHKLVKLGIYNIYRFDSILLFTQAKETSYSKAKPAPHAYQNYHLTTLG